MPELPDVEVFKNFVDATSLHQRIAGSAIRHPKIVRSMPGKKLTRLLKGRKLENTHRHGKVLFIELDAAKGWLWFHFGMTGYFTSGKKQDPEPENHIRFMLTFTTGCLLRFHCPRLFGQVGWVADFKEYVQRHKLGPDALAISQKDFLKRFQNTSGGIKAALMNQSLLAGIGNVYSDEILFKSRLHPQHSMKSLDTASFRRLYRDMRSVLTRAIKHHADPQNMPDSWLLHHRHAKATCPRCGGRITRTTVHQRSAYFCQSCQRKRA